jgi:hypothetical protein
MKIGLLIPSTSYGRNEWASYKDTYLYKHTLMTFLKTYDKDLHEHKFYIGIDRNDRIYDDLKTREEISRVISVMKNIDIQFIYMDNIKKGHLTVMWNKLYDIALDDGCDYFFQCGDDIEFKTKGWISDCITELSAMNDVGMVGPINNNSRILTQSFVSRKHKELFGYYFPPEIINWFCDDWINDIYKHMNRFKPLDNHICINVGGKPRYDINDDPTYMMINTYQKHNVCHQHCLSIIKRDIERLIQKLNKRCDTNVEQEADVSNVTT